MTAASETIPFLITLGHAGDDSFNLRFPPEYSEEILSLLDDNGIEHNTALEMSTGPEEWIEVINVLGVAGGLAGLAAVIKTFVHRHDGKRFVFKRGGSELEAFGFSEKETERLLLKMQAEQAELDAKTRRVLEEND